MKFFIDPDTHWDGDSYHEQFQTLHPRMSQSTHTILVHTSFHDAEVLSLKMNNLGTWGRPRVKDPTEIVIRLWHPNEYVYTLTYSGVTVIHFDVDTVTNRLDGVPEGQERYYQHDRRGIDDWLYDELTAHDDTYLSHEIQFASGATLLLRFKRIACGRSIGKRRYADANRLKGRLS